MSFQDLYDNDGDSLTVARKLETIRAIHLALGKANNRNNKDYLSKRDQEELPKPVNAALLRSVNRKKKDQVIDGQVLQVLKAARKYRIKQQKLRKKMVEEF